MATALSAPRTLLGDTLGRFIINRLSLRVRLDERRIAEILGVRLGPGDGGGASSS